MGIGSKSVEFIRQFFRQSEFHRPPYTPATAYGGMSQNAPYFSYGMTSGSLQGITDYLRVDSDLVARYIDYEDQDDSPLISSAIDVYCLSGDTKVPLLDGRTLTIKELAEMKDFNNLWAYSSDGATLLPARIKSAQKTGVNQKLLKVVLDDGTVIKATPNHKFMKRDGSFVELQSLRHGDSLMPLYRDINSKGYERVFIDGVPELTHRWVFRNANGYLPKNKNGKDVKFLRVIHHVDFNKRNNNPDNLQDIHWLEHKKIHNDHAKRTLHTPEMLAKASASGRLKITKYNKDRWLGEKRDYYSKISSRIYKKLWESDEFRNKMKPVQSANMKRLAEQGQNRHFGEDNCKFRSDVTYDDIIRVAKTINYKRVGKANTGPSKITIGKILGCKYRVLDKRVKDAGFNNWSEFKEKVLGIGAKFNHKVVSISECTSREDVYDLTIEGDHHCFAAGDGNGFVIVHNSDDATQVDMQTGKSVWIEAEDEDVREELDNLLHRTLNIEERLWGDIRQLIKYGNVFLENVVKDKVGVIAINTLPPPTIRRIEVPKQIGMDPNKPEDADIHWDTLGYIYDPRGIFKINTKQFIDELKYRVTGEMSTGDKPMGVSVFEGWEIVHMRLMGKTPYSLYGWGIGEPARWIFKRLLMLEDSIILHRLSRAPSRFAFYVDVSGVPPNETNAYLTRVKQGLKKQKFVNPNSGKMDQKYNPLSSDEDFILPVRDGKESTRVETLQGPIYDHIEDIKFFENKLFAALKVPKPFLTYEESTAKSHLSAEDARFARTILRIQREYRNGLKKVCKVHLAAKGLNPESIDFDVVMTVPSAIFELSQLEVRAAELELASKYDGWASKYWIKSHVLGWSDDQIRDSDPEGDSTPTPKGGGSGAIEKALRGKGDRQASASDVTSADTEIVATDAGTETASKDSPRRSDMILSAVRKNTEKLLERIETLHDKTSDKKWKEISATLKDLQHTIERK